MECFIPCQKVQDNWWKPAARAAFFPGILSLTLLISGLGNYSSRVPFGHPAGVINKNGVCYLATSIQMLDAVKFALGKNFDAIFESKGGLLEAYSSIHQVGQDFLGAPCCINPDTLIKKWVVLDGSFYCTPFIIKETRQHDGSVVEEELFPEKIGNGASGHVFEVLEEMMKELDNNCRDLDVSNPFAVIMQASRRSRTKNIFHKLSYVVSDSTCAKDRSTVVLDKDVVTTKQTIVKAPRLLTLAPNDGHYGHHIPLKLRFEDAQGCIGHYKLLASAYYLPVIRKGEGFVGNHVIALVRYGEKWYECDNHTITSFASEKAVAKWIDEAARINYRGRGMADNTLTVSAPMLSIYELI